MECPLTTYEHGGRCIAGRPVARRPCDGGSGNRALGVRALIHFVPILRAGCDHLRRCAIRMAGATNRSQPFPDFRLGQRLFQFGVLRTRGAEHMRRADGLIGIRR